MIKKVVAGLVFIILLSGLLACNRKVYVPPVPTKRLPTPLVNVENSQEIDASTEAQLPITSASEDCPFTNDNPATTPDQINPLLAHTKERYLSQIDKPGWYGSTNNYNTSQAWIYIDNPENKNIDVLFLLSSATNYSGPLGDVMIDRILLSDGKNGVFGLDEGGDKTTAILNAYPTNSVFSLEDGALPYSGILMNHFLNVFIDQLLINGKPMQGFSPGTTSNYSAWCIGEGDNRLLEIEIHSVGLAGRKSPESDARQTEVTSAYTFDWNTGNLLARSTLQHQTDGTSRETNWDIDALSVFHYQYYESLPPVIQQMYDEAAAMIRAEYAAKGLN